MASQNTGLEAAFRKTDALLNRSRVRHLYIGGLAVLATGEPRMTQDVDLILFVTKAGVDRLVDAFVDGGFSVNRRNALADAAERGALSVRYGGVAVDVILASTDLEESAWRRRRRRKLFGRTVGIPSPEDLILLKVIPGRPRDLDDVKGIVASTGPRLDRSYIRRWARRLCDRAEDMRIMRRLEECGALGGSGGPGVRA